MKNNDDDFGYLHSLDRLNDTLKTPSNLRRLNDTSPNDGDFNEDWKYVKSTLKFMTVPWDAHYQHVVDWKSDDERDAWFRQHKGNVVELESSWNYKKLEIFKPSLGKYIGNIDSPIPYEEAMGYNYLFVELYKQPIKDYQTPTRELFFYHITGIIKKSGNDCDLTLELDAWTEYKNSVTIESLDLERGHWAHCQIDRDSFLSDPLNSPVKLNEVEPDLPEVKPRVSYERFTPLYDVPMMVIVTPLNLVESAALWRGSPPADSDLTDFWWMHPEKFEIPEDKFDDSTISSDSPSFPPLPIGYERVKLSEQKIEDNSKNTGFKGSEPWARATANTIQSSNPTGLDYYAMPPTEYTKFITLLRRKYPHILRSITALFVVPKKFLILGTPFLFGGIPLLKMTPKTTPILTQSIPITPDLFQINPEYSQFAKLYTSQFSLIEISDVAGKTITVGCEDISGNKLHIYSRANVAFPFLHMEAFVDGVGGQGLNNYALLPLLPNAASMPQSLWEDLRFTFDIPTYALYADGSTTAIDLLPTLYTTVDNRNKKRQQSRYNAELTLANAKNNADSALNISNANAQTALTNATNSANTALANAQRAATCTKTIGTNNNIYQNTTTIGSINVDYDNTKRSIQLAYDIATKAANFTFNMNKLSTDYQDRMISQQVGWMKTRLNTKIGYMAANLALGVGGSLQPEQIAQFCASVSNINNLQSAPLASTTGVSNAGTSVNNAGYRTATGASFQTNGTVPGGDFAGLAWYTGMTAGRALTVGKQLETYRDWDVQEAEYSRDNQLKPMASETREATKTYNNDCRDTTKKCSETNNDDSKKIRLDNESARLDNTTTNIGLAYDMANTNANATNATAIGNAQLSYNTALSSALTTNDATLTNATNSYHYALYAIKQAAIITNTSMRSQLASYLTQSPYAVCENNGLGHRDNYAHRGIDIRVRTLSPADITHVGNTFKRYGYRMPPNTWISEPQWSLYTHYTYWKARDVWIKPSLMSETAKTFIKSILLNGTTIWDNPDNVFNKGVLA